jgi:uridine kinase
MGLSSKKTKPIIIGVCGRSCSGKSTVVRELEKKYNKHIVRISLDRFFKIYNPKELDETDGWESPASIRWDRFIYSLKKLKDGKSTHIPSKGWTEEFDELKEPKEIVIVEGYLIFTNEEVVDLLDKKIFVEVSDLNILYRRTLREGNIEGMQYTIKKVIPISKRYEDLQRKEADIIIDGNKSIEEISKEIEKHIKKWHNI